MRNVEIQEVNSVSYINKLPDNLKEGYQVKLVSCSFDDSKEEIIVTFADLETGSIISKKFKNPESFSEMRYNIYMTGLLKFASDVSTVKTIEELKEVTSVSEWNLEFAEALFKDSIGNEGRLKVHYASNTSKYNPDDYQGKSTDEIYKTLRTPLVVVSDKGVYYLNKDSKLEFQYNPDTKNKGLYAEHTTYKIVAESTSDMMALPEMDMSIGDEKELF